MPVIAAIFLYNCTRLIPMSLACDPIVLLFKTPIPAIAAQSDNSLSQLCTWFTGPGWSRVQRFLLVTLPDTIRSWPQAMLAKTIKNHRDIDFFICCDFNNEFTKCLRYNLFGCFLTVLSLPTPPSCRHQTFSANSSCRSVPCENWCWARWQSLPACAEAPSAGRVSLCVTLFVTMITHTCKRN